MQTSEGLAEAVVSARGRALDFLETAIGANGAWPCRLYPVPDPGVPFDPDDPWHLEHPPFVAGLGVLALEACDDPRADALRSRTRAFLRGCMEYPGVWRYWRGLPFDLDDTAICSLAAGPQHPWLLLGRNHSRILSCRDREGRFRTWMPAQEGSSALPDDVHPVVRATWDEADSVVNANVLAYLGDRPETRAAQRWIETLIEEHREAGTVLYPDPMDLHAALARASRLGRPVFARLRPVLMRRIMDRRDDEGGFGDPLRTAQALSALGALGGMAHKQAFQPSMERLIEAQCPDGGWPACFFYQDLNPPTRRFGAEVLTTVFCIEAMERFLRP